MAGLVENQKQVAPVCDQILEVLDDQKGKEGVKNLKDQWKRLTPLKTRYTKYRNTQKNDLETDPEINAVLAGGNKL